MENLIMWRADKWPKLREALKDIGRAYGISRWKFPLSMLQKRRKTNNIAIHNLLKASTLAFRFPFRHSPPYWSVINFINAFHGVCKCVFDITQSTLTSAIYLWEFYAFHSVFQRLVLEIISNISKLGDSALVCAKVDDLFSEGCSQVHKGCST